MDTEDTPSPDGPVGASEWQGDDGDNTYTPPSEWQGDPGDNSLLSPGNTTDLAQYDYAWTPLGDGTWLNAQTFQISDDYGNVLGVAQSTGDGWYDIGGGMYINGTTLELQDANGASFGYLQSNNPLFSDPNSGLQSRSGDNSSDTFPPVNVPAGGQNNSPRPGNTGSGGNTGGGGSGGTMGGGSGGSSSSSQNAAVQRAIQQLQQQLTAAQAAHASPGVTGALQNQIRSLQQQRGTSGSTGTTLLLAAAAIGAIAFFVNRQNSSAA